MCLDFLEKYIVKFFSGHQAILSAPWYLNYIKYGSDWVKFYKVDPSSFGGNATQQEYLLGGEVGTLKQAIITAHMTRTFLSRVSGYWLDKKILFTKAWG